MKKATMFTVYLSLWIVVLCSIGMAMTFLSEHLQSIGFFGDIKRPEPNRYEMIDHWFEWGKRHYWYFWMCLFLFLTSLARVIVWIVNYWKIQL